MPPHNLPRRSLSLALLRYQPLFPERVRGCNGRNQFATWVYLHKRTFCACCLHFILFSRKWSESTRQDRCTCLGVESRWTFAEKSGFERPLATRSPQSKSVHSCTEVDLGRFHHLHHLHLLQTPQVLVNNECRRAVRRFVLVITKHSSHKRPGQSPTISTETGCAL